MRHAHSTLENALLHARHHHYQQLTRSLVQMLQPWDPATDLKLTERHAKNVAIFEDFWRRFFNERGHSLEQIKNWALLVCAVVHAADVCEGSKKLAAQKCDDLAHALEHFLAQHADGASEPNVAPTSPVTNCKVLTLPVTRRDVPLPATKKPRVFGKPHLVPTHPRQ